MTQPDKQTTARTSASDASNVGFAMSLMPWSVGTRMAMTWLEGATRIQGEWTRFVAERLAKDAEMQHALLACQSPTEARQMGTDFLHCAVSDYLTETARITAMGSHLSQDAGL
ncbi:hypothetical protein [Jannaschia pohangensis]|uniref:Phasin protein n=1 Tax=Jannaschia pohangensis TaxID=390807 RepID=A0A1I3H0P0_9RHOB|nr:hypothetical protein [Jannaschia pohangensis]SFI29090.1 hypothetical protein SAMN04488095_0404 [Jannaschia pohangensis]